MEIMEVYTKNGKELRKIIGYEPDDIIEMNGKKGPAFYRPVPYTTIGEIVIWSLGGVCNICEGMID